MKFRDFFNLRQIIFSVVIIALILVLAYCSADDVVKVDFGNTQLRVSSDRYILTMDYTEIESACLADRPEDTGEQISSGRHDFVLVYGRWKNELWGEYHACIDLSSDKCIVLKLTDGQTYVFSRKSNAETEKIYQELLTRIQ